MKYTLWASSLLATCILSGSVSAMSQEASPLLKPLGHPVGAARTVIPTSSLPAANNGTTFKTLQAHTNTRIYVPAGWKPDEVAPPRPNELPPYPGYAYETPASLACLYSLVTPVPGCNPNSVTANPTEGYRAIAIVDAYDDPTAAADLAYFSAQFGLPFNPAQFQVVYQSGSAPKQDPTGGWEFEESLDIEYSHAMAPKAAIYLVETNSGSYEDLLTGVEIAGNLISCGSPSTCAPGATGKGEVSMSWGGPEFPQETSLDFVFTTPGVVYVAAAGDTAGETDWPCVSPNVVCAGGTTIRRNPYTGNFLQETTWTEGSGGVSLYEPIPSYQSSISNIVGPARGVPDVSLDSNPDTGAWIWDSNPTEEYDIGAGWNIVGGTSLATPTWAGIINRAGLFHTASQYELLTIYQNMGQPSHYNDITSGYCGPYAGFLATPGWDPCTGVGSPKGYGGK
jgi:kumamolisin